MIRKNTKKGFTLVELIVVITILAILGTITIVSFQGYGKKARDTQRISDIRHIKNSLDLFIVENGYLPNPTGGVEILYNGSTIWTQGTIGDSVIDIIGKINKKPVDPLTSTEYTYSKTKTTNEYQLGGILEGDPLSTYNSNIITGVYAISDFSSIITGNYNSKGIMVRSGTNCSTISTPSIILSDLGNESTLTLIGNHNFVINKSRNLPSGYGKYFKEDRMKKGPNFKVSVIYDKCNIKTITELEEYIDNLQVAYIQYELTEEEPYFDELVNNPTGNDIKIITINELKQSRLQVFDAVIDEVMNGNQVVAGNSSSTNGAVVLTKQKCELTGWEWISGTYDVYIGKMKGTGFCISPSFGDWQTNGLDLNDGAGGISFNGWGNESEDYYNGWDSSSISDSGNPYPQFGQTKSLNSDVSYDCKNIGEASEDFDSEDTIVGRMKWLTTTGNTYNQARSIDWITGLVPHSIGSIPHAIPALYIADCIDGVKDLTTKMRYKHIDNSIEIINYSDYSVDISSNTDDAALSNVTYQNRQKYLTAWTQMTGSHLPSAFSYISDGFASAEKSDGNNLTGNDRGEYQVACDYGIINDSTNDEWVWLSAIGNTDGTMWGRLVRVTGKDGCGFQTTDTTGSHDGSLSARFIVRP